MQRLNVNPIVCDEMYLSDEKKEGGGQTVNRAFRQIINAPIKYAATR